MTANDISPQQNRAIAALLSGTVEDAATVAGVTERTIYRWLNLPAFRQALASAEAEAVSHAARLMAGHVSGAILALAAVLADAEATHGERTAAARALLNALPNVRMVGSIESAIEELRNRDDIPKPSSETD